MAELVSFPNPASVSQTVSCESASEPTAAMTFSVVRT